MDSAVDTVVTELARTNTARALTRLAAELRSVWRAASRLPSEENRALIQQAPEIRRTLFPVQTAIFDTLARVGQESMQGSQGPSPQRRHRDSGTRRFQGAQEGITLTAESQQDYRAYVHEPSGWNADVHRFLQEGEAVQPPPNVDDIVRQIGREHFDVADTRPRWNADVNRYRFELREGEAVQPPLNFNDLIQQIARGHPQGPFGSTEEHPGRNAGPGVDQNDVSREGTADSWRTQLSIDDVSGSQGWLEEAEKEVEEQYGVAPDTEMPADVANLKEGLCRAKQACTVEDQRVSHLLAVALEAKTAMDKTKQVLQTNDKVGECVDAPGQAVLAALTALASKADQECVQAVERLTKHKQAFYVLQQAWQSMIGGGASLVPLCCICLTEGVDTACTPCGHTFCRGCAKTCQSRGKCPNCRAVIRSQHKLFFA